MRIYLFILFCCSAFFVSAQEMTGIWRGHFRSSNSRVMELMGQEDRYKFEVQLNQDAKAFEGVTYSYKTTVFYGKASCQGTFNAKTKKVFLEEMKIVEVRMAGGSEACIMTCFLQYSKLGDEEFLEGTYTSMNVKDSSNCGRGTIFLRKVTTSDFYKEPFLVKREKELEKLSEIKKDKPVAKANPVTKPPIKKPSTTPPPTTKKTTTPATKKPVTKPVTKPAPKNNNTAKNPANSKSKVVADPKATTPKQSEVKVVPIDSVKKAAPIVITPKVLATRENELVKTITTSANEIVVSIYDNGSIDNDTVSVYLDKKLVLSKKRLTDRALNVKFNLDETSDFHELVMVAENLGEIPPNTSLMVVKAGNKSYEVRITSTEQKNAVIIFKFEKAP